jgi:hypothetical protein
VSEPLDLDAIKTRLERDNWGHDDCDACQEFERHAREDVRALIAEVERLRLLIANERGWPDDWAKGVG